jgi:ribosomal-protein-alanine N-acetyltransferase
MNGPLVRRQMPLTSDGFDLADAGEFMAGKESLWTEHGFGPWAIWINGRFAGWGGL